MKTIIFGDNKNAAARFEKLFIEPVETSDNGGRKNPLSEAISAFNPEWDSETASDEAFAHALVFVIGIITREINRAKSEERAKGIVEKAFRESDGNVVVLPYYVPWQYFLIPTSAEYVLYPSNRGGYNLQTVRKDISTKESKRLLPEEWLSEKPEGCTFVHPGRFIACFENLRSAITVASELTS